MLNFSANLVFPNGFNSYLDCVNYTRLGLHELVNFNYYYIKVITIWYLCYKKSQKW